MTESPPAFTLLAVDVERAATDLAVRYRRIERRKRLVAALGVVSRALSTRGAVQVLGGILSHDRR
jgi:hypothetical protein